MYLALCAGVALTVVLSGAVSAADPPPDRPGLETQVPPSPPEPQAKPLKFSTTIAKLVEAGDAVPEGVAVTEESVSAASPGIEAYFNAGLLRLDAAGRVQVYIRVSRVGEDVLAGLESRGAVIERRDESGTLVQASVPVQSLAQVAGLEYVTVITAPSYGHVNVGSALTEGDAILDSLAKSHGRGHWKREIIGAGKVEERTLRSR